VPADVFAGVDRHPHHPGLFVLLIFKGTWIFQPLKQHLLAYVLGVGHRIQDGIGQPQEPVGVGLHQPGSQRLLRMLRHESPSFFSVWNAFT